MPNTRRIRIVRSIQIGPSRFIPAGTLGEERRRAHSQEVGREVVFATVATEEHEVVLFAEEVEYID